MRTYYQQFLLETGLPVWLVPTYGFMLVVSIILGSLWTIRLWASRGHSREAVSSLIFWSIPGLFIGARLLYMLQFGFPDSWSGVLFGRGIALYGGFFGVITPWVIGYLRRPFDVLGLLDSVTPPFALGLFLVRIGCFLHGCNGGLLCSYPWAVQFPRGTSSYGAQVRDGLIGGREAFSLPVHPTQLYESLFGLLCLPFLYLLFQKSRRPGETFAVGMVAYALYRFATEPIRSDTTGLHPLGMTFAQFVSVLIVLLAGTIFCWVRTRKPIPRAFS